MSTHRARTLTVPAVATCCVVALAAMPIFLAGEPAKANVRSVAFSPDGKLLAASTGGPKERGKVIFWNLDSAKVIWAPRRTMGRAGARLFSGWANHGDRTLHQRGQAV